MDDVNDVNDFGPVIYSYSRAQAIEDGFLVDVSEMAREAGIKYPVVITARLHAEYITPTAAEEKHGQSYTGRLWDVLWMFRCYARKNSSGIMYYPVIFAQEMKTTKHRLKQVTKKLKAVCCPGDDGEPVITIMLPDED